MKTFKDYETLIRECVSEINEQDPDYNWSVRSIDEYRVCIYWSYLKWERNDCFLLRLAPPIDFGEYFITCRDPHDNMIEGHFVSDEVAWSLQESWEDAIIRSICELASYAHDVY